MADMVLHTTPVGRFVGGNADEPTKTQYKKSSPSGGEDDESDSYFCAVAIRKQGEQHWNQTEWGGKIWNAAVAGYPNNEHQHRDFAWKIIDGDSQEKNKQGNRPCDYEEQRGCWVLRFNTKYPPSLYDAEIRQVVMEKGKFPLGCYIQVGFTVKPNKSTQSPGMYLTQQSIAYRSPGKLIERGIDPKHFNFGEAPLPSEAIQYMQSMGMAVPQQTQPVQQYAQQPMQQPQQYAQQQPQQYAQPVQQYAQQPMQQSQQAVAQSQPVQTVQTLPPAYPEFTQNALNEGQIPAQATTPIVPMAPAQRPKIMTEKAGGAPYESWVKNNWTDAMLISEGYMLP